MILKKNIGKIFYKYINILLVTFFCPTIPPQPQCAKIKNIIVPLPPYLIDLLNIAIKSWQRIRKRFIP